MDARIFFNEKINQFLVLWLKEKNNPEQEFILNQRKSNSIMDKSQKWMSFCGHKFFKIFLMSVLPSID